MGSAELPKKVQTTPATSLELSCDSDDFSVQIPELKPRFRLSTLMLALTSNAVCLAIARNIPELAMVMVFVMAIAMIRLLYGIQLHVNAGVSLSFRREVILYLMSILAVISIAGFVVLAFSVTLGVCVGLALIIAHNTEVRQTEWIFGGFISGWIAGLVAAMATGGWFFQAIWFTNLLPNQRNGV